MDRWIHMNNMNIELTNEYFFMCCRYLQTRSPHIRSRFLIPTLQSIFLLCAALCSFSRITDHRHHWWDVLAGAIIGIGFATATVICFSFFPFVYQSQHVFFIFEIFSAFSSVKISKPRKWWPLSQCFKMEIQSIIDIPAFVVYYPNGQKMNWIWIMLWFHKQRMDLSTSSLFFPIILLFFIHQLHGVATNIFTEIPSMNFKKTPTYTLNLNLFSGKRDKCFVLSKEVPVTLAHSRQKIYTK